MTPIWIQKAAAYKKMMQCMTAVIFLYREDCLAVSSGEGDSDGPPPPIAIIHL